MAAVSVILVARGAASAIERTLLSLQKQQGEPGQVELVFVQDKNSQELSESLGRLLDSFHLVKVRREEAGVLAELWNEGLLRSTASVLLILEPGQILAEASLSTLLQGLSEDESFAGAFGRTAVVTGDADVREHPDSGKTGRIFNRLIEKKHFVACTGCVLFRRECFEGYFNEIYGSGEIAFFEHLLHVAHFHPFRFVNQLVVTAPNVAHTQETLEEMVKALVAVLYGVEDLSERCEQKVRKRLARALLALGKSFYRREQYEHAGRYINQAVKMAPTYFKGRRYQFLNFVKDLLSRS